MGLRENARLLGIFPKTFCRAGDGVGVEMSGEEGSVDVYVFLMPSSLCIAVITGYNSFQIFLLAALGPSFFCYKIRVGFFLITQCQEMVWNYLWTCA
jgi:hypothetical protein